MSKCGKGCMPECGYFTTGGCISPFNCPYKIETGYINSTTSIPTYMEQYNGMSDDDVKHLKAEIARLTAENAELRARLEKAEELPCKVGDTVYLICDVGARKVIRKYRVDGFMYDGEIGWRISIEIACPQISLIGDRIFFTRAEAEARLKEIKEKNND